MTVSIIVTLRPLPGKFGELEQKIREMLPATRQFKGCLQGELLLAPARNELAVFQIWETTEALDDYLTWRAERDEFMQLNGLIAEEQDFRTFSLG